MKPEITTKDRNVMTFTLAVLAMSVIILGVSFSYPEPKPDVIHSMDVILTQKSNPKTPDDADFLAQSNQLGGGTKDQPVRPSNPFSSVTPVAEGLSKQESQRQRKAVSEHKQVALLTQQQSSRQALSQNNQKPTPNKNADTTKETPEQRLAQLQNEIAKKIEAYAQKPRSKYVSSSTKAYELAPYINQWVRKIERTGDLNYPEQAKNRNFTGSVMLTVGINRDGSLHEIKIIKASKHNFLDEAAKHIVELAQPFDPLPESQEQVDVLYITRTWQFLPGHLLRHK